MLTTKINLNSLVAGGVVFLAVLLNIQPALTVEEVPLSPGNQDISPMQMTERTDKVKPQQLKISGPIWNSLERMSMTERKNSEIDLILEREASEDALQTARRIENLWNSGNFDGALSIFPELEKVTDTHEMSIGNSWRTPVPTENPDDWGGDIRIGTRDSVYVVSMDIHRSSGNLFAVLLHQGDGAASRWVVNHSTDGGTTWSETYSWVAGYYMNSISASVVASHCYVGFSRGTLQDEAFLYRFRASDGQQENFNNGSTYITIFSTTPPEYIEEVAMSSTQDLGNHRLYYLAITSEGNLRYFKSNEPYFEDWFEISTGVTDADRGLDVTTNEGFTEYYLFASYIDASGYLHIASSISPTGGWIERISYPIGSTTYYSSVGAYHNAITCAFDYDTGSDYIIRYLTSTDGGEIWYWGAVDDTTSSQDSPDITARGGGGVGITYGLYTPTREGRFAWSSDAGWNWSEPETVTDYGPVWWIKPSIEYLGNNVYGVVYGTDVNGPYMGAAYFDRGEPLDTTAPSDVSDLSIVTMTDTSVTLQWTAPADDGGTGDPASEYDVRYSTSIINASNFNSAAQASGEPTPGTPGSTESFTVGGLSAGTQYWFAMKTADEVPNWSDISNVPDTTTLSAPDDTAPAAVTLNISEVGNNWVELTWNAPGDDGIGGGPADAYDVRYSTSIINASNFNSATEASGEPSPGTPGSTESFTVGGLDPDTQYWFAMKTADEIPNWSDISTVPDTTTLSGSDVTAPDAVDLDITAVGNSSVSLEWTAPADDGMSGGPGSEYDVRYSTSEIDASNFDSATQATGEPDPGQPGTAENFTIGGLDAATHYWFAMKTADEVPNWSDISNVVDSTTTSSVIPGDMNSDGQLTVIDLTLIVSLILEDSTFTADDSTAADMNVDSNIDILDVVLLIGDILGLESPLERDMEELLDLVGVNLDIGWIEGGVLGVSVGLTGSQEVGGMEFRLRYDRSKYELIDIAPGSNQEGLNVSYRDNDGAVKVLVYAPNGSGGIKDGEVFSAGFRPFDLSSGGASGVRVEKVILSDLRGSSLDHQLNGIGEDGEISLVIPRTYRLHQNYPNPFNPSTTIVYEIPSLRDPVDVRLDIYDLRGRLVRRLVDEKNSPGVYEIQWDGHTDRGERASSGVYFYQITAGDFISTRKLVVVK